MKRNLVSQSQPFGEVISSVQHSSHGTASPLTSKPLSAKTERFNNGVDQVQSFANKAPGAREKGCAHSDNPFAFVGKGFESKPTFVGIWPSPL